MCFEHFVLPKYAKCIIFLFGPSPGPPPHPPTPREQENNVFCICWYTKMLKTHICSMGPFLQTFFHCFVNDFFSISEVTTFEYNTIYSTFQGSSLLRGALKRSQGFLPKLVTNSPKMIPNPLKSHATNDSRKRYKKTCKILQFF